MYVLGLKATGYNSNSALVVSLVHSPVSLHLLTPKSVLRSLRLKGTPRVCRCKTSQNRPRATNCNPYELANECQLLTCQQVVGLIVKLTA